MVHVIRIRLTRNSELITWRSVDIKAATSKAPTADTNWVIKTRAPKGFRKIWVLGRMLERPRRCELLPLAAGIQVSSGGSKRLFVEIRANKP